MSRSSADQVTPLAGVWIEIGVWAVSADIIGSLPSRECGLKWDLMIANHVCEWVTPLAGVWIEIWISCGTQNAMKSLPSRECGLKYNPTLL